MFAKVGLGQLSAITIINIKNDSLIGINKNEKAPEFPGGNKEINKFINKHMLYPQRAKEEGIEGKCYMSFIVDTTGEVCEVKLIKGLKNCEECDRDAIRLTKIMPRWKPYLVDGKKQRCKIIYTINFRMI